VKRSTLRVTCVFGMVVIFILVATISANAAWVSKRQLVSDLQNKRCPLSAPTCATYVPFKQAAKFLNELVEINELDRVSKPELPKWSVQVDELGDLILVGVDIQYEVTWVGGRCPCLHIYNGDFVACDMERQVENARKNQGELEFGLKVRE
jgi:hypothetical protein